jgi:DNA-binding MarR family transcriptional regulator
MSDDPVCRIQRAYPQVWFACHVEHRTRSTGDGLTDREVGVLAHLDGTEGVRPTDLARHLGIGRPALSAQLQRLVARGLIQYVDHDGDRRERRVRLTDGGRAAWTDRSPLPRERVEALLALLTDDDRARAVEGLELLARAARRLHERRDP